MKVIYMGPSPLGYHSAPSGFNYMFDPGVAQVVQKGDEMFFKSIIKAPGSDFENGNWKTTILNKGTAKDKDPDENDKEVAE